MSPRILSVCLLLALHGPAAAQAPGASYERQLLRLSELMGALHVLRGLCSAADAPAYRDRMAALIDGEDTDTDRRERLAGAFNRGYRTFRLTYRTCNVEARQAIRSYLDEADRIAREIRARYAE